MQKDRLIYLLHQYTSGQSSGADARALAEFLSREENKDMALDALQEMALSQSFEDVFDEQRFLPLLRGIVKIDKIPNEPEVVPVAMPIHRIPFYRRWWAAASVILALGIGAYLWTVNKKNTSSAEAVAKSDITQDIPPGKDGAILTLADGTQVVLDSLGNGVIALQNGSQAVIKNGELVYDLTGDRTGEAVYNTMITPKGRQYSILLPDGTRAWLNAASSIRYPTVFSGQERKVEVKGEVYFEVAKHTKMPFRVNVNDRAEVEVLGTHFNVNAYENEGSINTTLLEGSVRIVTVNEVVGQGGRHVGHKTRHGNGAVLKPGQQAQIALSAVALSSDRQPSSSQPIKVINDADIDKVMAWKNGLFNFNDVPFEEAMRQLERWYDIKVIYENGVPDYIELNGKITKGVTLNDLLVGLGKIGMKCRLEGRNLIVEK